MSTISSRGEQLCDDLFAALRELCVGPTGTGLTLIQGVISRGDLVDGQTMAGFFHDAGEALRASGRVYAMDDSVMYEQRGENGHALVQIASASRVESCAPALLTNVIAACVQHQKGEIQSTISARLIYALLSHESLRSQLACIRDYARRPLYDGEFVLRGPGWHPDPGILVHGPDITPAPFEPPGNAADPRDRLPSLLRELLRDYCWAGPADMVNALGMLLTGLLVNHFVEEPHPIGLLDGNQPDVGKTHFVRTVGLVLDSTEPAPMRYTSDDELEKKLAARLRDMFSSVLLLDNVRTKVDSEVLEMHSMSPRITIRRLGHTFEISRRNLYLWFMTSNGTRTTRDFLTRTVPIRLRYEGNTCERTFARPDLLSFAREHRLEILGELAGMVERWRLAGSRPGGQQHRCRCWAAAIGGILDTAGLGTHFLANIGDAEREMDEGVSGLTALAEHVLRSGSPNLLSPPGETAKSWVPHLWHVGALPTLSADEKPQVSTTRAGQFLASMVNRAVPVETDNGPCLVTLRSRSGRSNQTRYSFDVVALDTGVPRGVVPGATPAATPSAPTSQIGAPSPCDSIAADAGACNDLDWGP
jgi:hypothetical protein